MMASAIRLPLIAALVVISDCSAARQPNGADVDKEAIYIKAHALNAVPSRAACLEVSGSEMMAFAEASDEMQAEVMGRTFEVDRL